MKTTTVKIAIFDDCTILRESIGKLLSVVPEFYLVGTFPDPMKIVEICRKHSPDVVLMDIDMPGMSGIEAVKLISPLFPDTRVLMLTVFEDDDNIFHSICNGACGYLLKKTDPLDMIDAIKEAYHGGAPITPSIAIKVLDMFRKQNISSAEDTNLNARELEILTLLAKGFSYKMIAAECNICIDTVRFYIKKIYEKLHVHSMTEAVSKAIRNRIVK
jgi:DNA-binding NarL/FixJ family response regulator